jgi:hypothetical protein
MTERVPNSGKRASYSPPSLLVYGGLAKLTAAGSSGNNEATGMPLDIRKA